MTFDVAHDLLKMMRDRKVHLVPQYEEVIQRISDEGFSYCTPAMLGMTQTLFDNKRMIAHNLLQNAIDEAKGAARVNIVAENYANPELRDKMKRHVGDELRHSKMFADAIALTGFQSEKEEGGSVQETVDQVFEFDDDLVTFLCRVHSIEIRSWTMLRLYIAML